jgi:hypothetical protein
MPQFIAQGKVLLIKKPGIDAEDNGDVGIIAGANQADDASDHLGHVLAVVAVPLAPAENGVDDLAFPDQV